MYRKIVVNEILDWENTLQILKDRGIYQNLFVKKVNQYN